MTKAHETDEMKATETTASDHNFMERLEAATVDEVWYTAQTPWHRQMSVGEYARVRNGVIDRHIFISTAGESEPMDAPLWLSRLGQLPNALGFRRLGFKRVAAAKVPPKVLKYEQGQGYTPY